MNSRTAHRILARNLNGGSAAVENYVKANANRSEWSLTQCQLAHEVREQSHYEQLWLSIAREAREHGGVSPVKRELGRPGYTEYEANEQAAAHATRAGELRFDLAIAVLARRHGWGK